MAEAGNPVPVWVAGRYSILEALGSGGFGSVFKAVDQELERVVAVKIADQIKDADQESLERFRREALAAANLRHPSIPTVHDSGRQGEVVFSDGSARRFPFIVMEFVDGPNLRALAASGIGAERSVAVVLDVLAALEAAHAQGVWHRDVKPANIVVPATGPAKLVDFGIAKLRDATSLTAGAGPATYVYASPEQIRGNRPLDGRTDLYSTGCVLYELLTGRRAFDGDSLPSLVLAHFETIPRPPADLDPSLPQALSRAVMKAISQDPADRFQTAAEFAHALRHALAPPPTQVPAPLPYSPHPGAGLPGQATSGYATRPHMGPPAIKLAPQADPAPVSGLTDQISPPTRPFTATSQPTEAAPAPGELVPATRPYSITSQPTEPARPTDSGGARRGRPQGHTREPQPTEAAPVVASVGRQVAAAAIGMPVFWAVAVIVSAFAVVSVGAASAPRTAWYPVIAVMMIAGWAAGGAVGRGAVGLRVRAYPTNSRPSGNYLLRLVAAALPPTVVMIGIAVLPPVFTALAFCFAALPLLTLLAALSSLASSRAPKRTWYDKLSGTWVVDLRAAKRQARRTERQ
ncbi:MAG: protein kinase [Bifidobacteriaceae bacterium]|jgi:serine/threonine-protein kinase|nr:protein kinase [Bifidobacteriaceae bacterium]